MFCYYLVGNLNGKALMDACYSLADIYSWQLEQTLKTNSPIMPPIMEPVSYSYRTDSKPFIFDED
jgi:hypothetical protein